jgi:hypothetical protein
MEAKEVPGRAREGRAPPARMRNMMQRGQFAEKNGIDTCFALRFPDVANRETPDL